MDYETLDLTWERKWRARWDTLPASPYPGTMAKILAKYTDASHLLMQPENTLLVFCSGGRGAPHTGAERAMQASGP